MPKEGFTDRTCLFCKHFEFDPGSPHYSELTPGIDSEFICHKGRWSMSNWDNRSDFVDAIAKGLTCQDFKEE